jgi:hypothetical protein
MLLQVLLVGVFHWSGLDGSAGKRHRGVLQGRLGVNKVAVNSFGTVIVAKIASVKLPAHATAKWFRRER